MHLVTDGFLRKINDKTLKKLECWNYTGIFNAKKVSFCKNTVRFHKNLKTVEFRIGEMSFEYDVLVKRIIHCHKIVQDIILELLKYNPNIKLKLKNG
jgi:hypothetical protein